KLSEAEDSTLSNHDTATDYDSTDESSVYITPLPPLEKLASAKHEPSSTPAKDNKKGSSASKSSSAPAGKIKNVKVEDDPPLAIVMKELNELKLKLSKKKSSHFRNHQPQQTSQHHTSQGESSLISRPSRLVISFPSCTHCGYNDHQSDVGIKPRNPQHVIKNYETCGSNVHTTTDHNDIECFRKGEAKKARVNKTASSNVQRSNTPTQRLNNLKEVFLSTKIFIKDLLKKYDINGSLVKTPMVSPNKLGRDLNGKAVNKTRYKGMIGSLMYLTASRPDIQFSTCLCARYQANPKESHLIVVKRIFRKSTSGACQLLGGKLVCWNAKKSAICSYVPTFCDNTSAIAILNNPGKQFIPTQHQLADIFTKPLDEPTQKRLIVELALSSEVTESLNMYKEYLAEFWYSAKALENSKVSILIPTGGIYGEVGLGIGFQLLDMEKKFEPKELSGRVSFLLGGDYANIFLEDIINKLKTKQRESLHSISISVDNAQDEGLWRW
ncbi:hypothetical protein Tco_0319973, partial [Tanacetum coccineum]